MKANCVLVKQTSKIIAILFPVNILDFCVLLERWIGCHNWRSTYTCTQTICKHIEKVQIKMSLSQFIRCVKDDKKKILFPLIFLRILFRLVISGKSLITDDTLNEQIRYKYLVGIYSFGIGLCGNSGFPGVYTVCTNVVFFYSIFFSNILNKECHFQRVDQHLDWILEHMKPWWKHIFYLKFCEFKINCMRKYFFLVLMITKQYLINLVRNKCGNSTIIRRYIQWSNLMQKELSKIIINKQIHRVNCYVSSELFDGIIIWHTTKSNVKSRRSNKLNKRFISGENNHTECTVHNIMCTKCTQTVCKHFAKNSNKNGSVTVHLVKERLIYRRCKI